MSDYTMFELLFVLQRMNRRVKVKKAVEGRIRDHLKKRGSVLVPSDEWKAEYDWLVEKLEYSVYRMRCAEMLFPQLFN